MYLSTMSIGRNDPCPCGSGRKYKKCHGLSVGVVASPDVARAGSLKVCDVELHDRLLRFARAQHGPHWLHDALTSANLLDDDSDLPAPELQIVIPWLLYFRQNAAGVTLADEWRLERQHRITADERTLLEAWRTAWMSLWEVRAVEAGRGSHIRDLLTGQERFVHDVSSTATLRRFDTVLAITLTCDDVSFFGGLHAYATAPRDAAAVVRQTRRICRVRTRPVAPEKLRDPDIQLRLFGWWRAAVHRAHHQPPPTLQNTDGDPLVVTRDDFAILASHDTIRERLAALPGAQDPELEDGQTVIVITRSGNAMHRSWQNTVIGRVILTRTRLWTESNSIQRADALRAAILSQLHGLVRFRLRNEQTAAQLMAAARATGELPRKRRDEAVPPELQAEVRRMKEQHMRDWIDNRIPALGGLTPREAARMPRVRPQLEILLKELEQHQSNLPAPEQIDLQWLHETLGFPDLGRFRR